ncbi:MAG: flagellar biosynthesis protein FlhF [Bdellovibrionaceae bacterium]|nr:flagellar biosynthesis protein FlhF [Bdellovibrionales bacterium]MCB9086525.1 flagellar biosynthesis protein FlhF [Pseudobdellovibrionaceae bacterium]
MQVKKFEARSMKEALEMVKLHLGPEAIILAARDHNKGFGLVGQTSVEVTAAVSEETLRKKLLAEKKMNQEIRAKFNNSPARIQKKFIDKAFFVGMEDVMRRPITAIPYIDIGDEGEEAAASREAQVAVPKPPVIDEEVAAQRIRSAVKSALSAGLATMEEKKSTRPVRAQAAPKAEVGGRDTAELTALRGEISYLKGMLEKFQQVPQNFVTMHPGAEDGIPYELTPAYEKLKRAGISKENTVEILKQCMKRLDSSQLKKPPFVDAWVAKYLLDEIKIAEHRTRARYHAFVGPSGQGKTTSLVKIASHLVICEKKKVAIMTTDYGKVGAAEQLRIYAQILNIPFAIVRRKRDWEVIQQKLGHIDHFLVDFPGMNLRSIGELDFLRDILPPEGTDRRIHYVQSVLAKDADAFEIAGRYMTLGFQDVIFTCLDESVQHGLIFNFQKKFGVPLHSFGIGPKVPEDLEAATKERVVDLIFKLTKIRKP